MEEKPTVEVDDNRIAQRIREEIFVPALQQAVGEAQKLNGSPNDIVNGAMMAFGDMMTTLTGKQGAVVLLRGFADFIERGNPN